MCACPCSVDQSIFPNSQLTKIVHNLRKLFWWKHFAMISFWSVEMTCTQTGMFYSETIFSPLLNDSRRSAARYQDMVLTLHWLIDHNATDEKQFLWDLAETAHQQVGANSAWRKSRRCCLSSRVCPLENFHLLQSDFKPFYGLGAECSSSCCDIRW